MTLEQRDEESRGFVLRIAPSRVDRVEEALNDNELIIGWGQLPELLNNDLSWNDFRQLIHDKYHSKETDFRRSGRAAGNMDRFIREMDIGHLVVVPHKSNFYIARITADAYHDPTRVGDDAAFRRPVEWLNDKKPIPRRLARVALQSRMKIQNTSADATDLLTEIKDALHCVTKNQEPTFEQDLRTRLIETTLEEMRTGRLDNYKFENLIKTLLQGMGATDTKIVPRLHDKGADIVATVRAAGILTFTLAVQVKHYNPEPPVGASEIDQLVRGMEFENADLGWFATSGTFSQEAVEYVAKLQDDRNIRIELADGDFLASMIVEHGLITGFQGDPA